MGGGPTRLDSRGQTPELLLFVACIHVAYGCYSNGRICFVTVVIYHVPLSF